ncbi:hypothetical protein HCQ94_04530 [Actinomyces sp. zg-332]|uniref:GDSL-type esterase/lipase family protein n=1 Tax=Actinomyces sp. zg-332 TaxID=2708340 RepID=UPI001421355A|nr:GDSL-type esterase/lipase family protein [Actinomyces sp. zg-332]QPK93856.1 hypothetical protein HCQ94_04530 [Actinomyces sp. zg-332]
MEIQDNDVILFLGDSIMDVQRDNTNPKDIGTGFPKIVTDNLIRLFPDKNLKFYNCSVGGQTVKETNDRISRTMKDLEYKPTIVILLIGINDVWNNQYDSSFGSLQEQTRFSKEYAKLLETICQYTNRIVILEPYVLPYPPKRKKWRVDLDSKIQIIKTLSERNDYEYIALDSIFNTIADESNAVKYTGEDGVHPTLLGHNVIADCLMKIF